MLIDALVDDIETLAANAERRGLFHEAAVLYAVGGMFITGDAAEVLEFLAPLVREKITEGRALTAALSNGAAS